MLKTYLLTGKPNVCSFCILPIKVGTDLRSLVLSGASAKFRPLLADVQSRASCEADVSDADPTHRDVYARSSRPSASRTASSISLQVSKRRPLSASDLRVFHQGSIKFKYAA